MPLIVVSRLLLTSLCLSLLMLLASPVRANSSSIFVDQPSQLTPIDVVVGLSRPPFVIEQNDEGYEIELITAVLRSMEYQPKFIYVPLGRTLRMLDQGMGAMLLTVNSNIVPNSIIRTKPYITYQNRAVYKSNSKFKVDEYGDLSTLRVVAFQGATNYLNGGFASSVRFNRNYFEVPNQLQQVRLLLEDRIDVAVMEENIFRHILEQVQQPQALEGDGQLSADDFRFSPLFEPNEYSAAFKDPSLVPIFNEALDNFKATKEFELLKAKYQIRNQ